MHTQRVRCGRCRHIERDHGEEGVRERAVRGVRPTVRTRQDVEGSRHEGQAHTAPIHRHAGQSGASGAHGGTEDGGERGAGKGSISMLIHISSSSSSTTFCRAV